MNAGPDDPLAAYLNEVANLLVGSFDVYRNDRLGDLPLAFSAVYRRRDERYLVTRTVKIWEVENRLQIFVASRFDPDDIFLDRFESALWNRASGYSPAGDHMSTVFLGVMVSATPVVEEFARKVLKYRKLKFFRLGFRGWAEIYLALVDFPRGRTLIHPKGRLFMEPFENRLEGREI